MYRSKHILCSLHCCVRVYVTSALFMNVNIAYPKSRLKKFWNEPNCNITDSSRAGGPGNKVKEERTPVRNPLSQPYDSTNIFQGSP